MQDDIERILIPRSTIAQRVVELARQITSDHARAISDTAEELTIVPILTGAMVFCGDLIREMPVPLRIALFAVSSYPGTSIASQGAQVILQQLGDLAGRHVLLLDDILDSGRTLGLVVPLIRSLKPASLRTCVLLR